MGRIIEQPAGKGSVSSQGAKVADVEYSITVFQRTHDVGPGEEIDGLEEVTGGLTWVAGMSLFEMMERDDLVLHLADGRRWRFAVSDLDGTVSNTGEGGIYKERAKP